MEERDQGVEGAVQRAGAGAKRVRALPGRPPAAAAPLSPLGAWQRELEGGSLAREARRGGFSHCRLLREWDCFQGEGPHQVWWPPYFLRRRQPIHEVVAAAGLVLALAHSGACTVYDQDSSQPLCFLNVAADENVRSLFVDPRSSSLLSISTFLSDPQQRLKVRSTPLAALRAGRPQGWRPLFESEVLSFPGFVEFDDVSCVAVTYSAEAQVYKLWDLQDPVAPRFHISSQGIRDVKIAAGALLLLMEPGPDLPGKDYLRLRVLDLMHGDCVQDVCLPLRTGRIVRPPDAIGCGIEVVELFGLHLLTRESGGPLSIRHILTGDVREVPSEAFKTPNAFIFLPFNNTFITFYKFADAKLHNFEGECLATLPGAWLPSSAAAATVYVSDGQDLLFIHCPPGSVPGSSSGGGGAAAGGAAAGAASAAAGEEAEADEEARWWEWSGGARQQVEDVAAQQHGAVAQQQNGCIKVFDLLTGRQVAVVKPPLPRGGKVAPRDAVAAAAARAALWQCSTLFYCEASRRIYTGTTDGKVQAWGL